MLSKSSLVLFLVLALNTARATRVEFYNTRSCSGAPSYEFRDAACNRCYDPPGDWFAVRFTDISSNQRVSTHNQNGCTPASAVGQSFGPVCRVAGNTPQRSAWVACPGQKFNALNNTGLNESLTVPTDADDDV